MVKRKTRKNKKNRHIITRKNKRKRRRKTKKRKAGTKGKAPPGVNKRVFELRNKPKTEAFTKKKLRNILKRSSNPSKLRKMTKRAKEKKRVTFQPIQNEEGKNDNANDMAVNTELTELFSNLTPPSYASREHDSTKTLASPPPNK